MDNLAIKILLNCVFLWLSVILLVVLAVTY
jgi:hypothetical protein